MIRTKVSGLTQIINKYQDKARRVARIDGASSEIHNVLLNAHRERIYANPVGRNRNLGPSITEPSHPNHIFSVDANNNVTFGTLVIYANSYNERTDRDLVAADENIKAGIKTAIVKYVGLK